VGGWNPFCSIVVVVVVVCTVARKLRGWEEGDGVEGGGRFGLGEWGRRWRGFGGWGWDGWVERIVRLLWWWDDVCT